MKDEGLGAWGTAIFSDDLATDVRGDFRDLIGDGLSSEDATQRLVDEYGPSVTEDVDDGPVFWLALAATQWKLGRLEEPVKVRALRIIEDGSDLRRWEAEGVSSNLRMRRKVLEFLREQLLSSPPPLTRIRPRYRQETEFEVGDVVAYMMNSGRVTLLHVVGHHVDKGGRMAIVEVLDWQGDRLPSTRAISRLKRKDLTTTDRRCTTRFVLSRSSKRDYPADRLKVVARRKTGPSKLDRIYRPYHGQAGRMLEGTGFRRWKDLDDYLMRAFDLT